jgi:hypothetical protein
MRWGFAARLPAGLRFRGLFCSFRAARGLAVTVFNTGKNALMAPSGADSEGWRFVSRNDDERGFARV